MSKPARPRPASPQIVDPPTGRPSAPSVPPPPARPQSRLARRLGLLAAVATGIVVLSVLNESRLEAADTTQYPPLGRLVSVGGGRMHLNCTGKGSPTVVIDAGLGDWSMTWHAVQNGVAHHPGVHV